MAAAAAEVSPPGQDNEAGPVQAAGTGKADQSKSSKRSARKDVASAERAANRLQVKREAEKVRIFLVLAYGLAFASFLLGFCLACA